MKAKKLGLLLLSCFALAGCGGKTSDEPVKGSQELAPAGSKTQIFEAEYVNCDAIETAGWSGGSGGTDIIAVDNNNLGASNGFYVTYLYKEGVTLQFDITSDKAVSDVTFVARLSAEGGTDFTITKDNYTREVNGTAINYPAIQFKDVPGLGKAPLAFKDYTIGRSISLNEGVNTIKLVTSNSTSLGGTTLATAPRVDCIKLTTSAELTWNPIESNLDSF